MKNEYEYKRAMIFFERGTIVHASVKNLHGDFFINGIIVEISKKHIVIRDRKDGSQKFIFFDELKKSLEPFKEVGE